MIGNDLLAQAFTRAGRPPEIDGDGHCDPIQALAAMRKRPPVTTAPAPDAGDAWLHSLPRDRRRIDVADITARTAEEPEPFGEPFEDDDYDLDDPDQAAAFLEDYADHQLAIASEEEIDDLADLGVRAVKLAERRGLPLDYVLDALINTH